MENRLMDKHEVASFIGGISPRTAGELMRSMPCVNVSSGNERKRLRVYQSDLEKWLESRKSVQSPSLVRTRKGTTTKNKPLHGEGLDENGFILKRHTKAG